MKDNSDYRSLTPKDGWLKKSCERCNGDFWLAPGQFKNIRFCKDSCRHEPAEVRFWKSVTKGANPDDCWTTSFTPKAKYPSMKVNGVQMRCSRFVLELALGRPIGEKLEACHQCDNPRCVRVGEGHIFEGTQKQNIQGCVARGRHVGNRILTDDQVREIRALKGKMGVSQVSELFGRPEATIYNIWLGYNRGSVSP